MTRANAKAVKIQAGRLEETRRYMTEVGHIMEGALKDQGREEEAVLSRRTTLFMLTRKRFPRVPPRVVVGIIAESDIMKLNGWLIRVANAQRLDDLGIEPSRDEARTTRRTLAEVLKDEGRQEEAVLSRRNILEMLLRTRFTKVPAKVAAHIEAETDTAKLDEWLSGVLTAQRLDDLGIV
jgi:hypothetical protein